MGLDHIYVGSLTRYYAGDWETIVQLLMLVLCLALYAISLRWSEGRIERLLLYKNGR